MICTSFQDIDEILATWRRGLSADWTRNERLGSLPCRRLSDVMAGDNDENSIFEQRAKSRLEAGSVFFFFVVSKEHKAVLGHVSRQN